MNAVESGWASFTIHIVAVKVAMVVGVQTQF